MKKPSRKECCRMIAMAIVLCLIALVNSSQAQAKYRSRTPRFRTLAQELAIKFPRSLNTNGTQNIDNGEQLDPSPENSYLQKPPAKPADKTSFFMDKNDTGTRTPVPAVLAVVGKHCIIYVEEGIKIEAAKLKNAANEFDQKIYPISTEWFGSEWKPGIDKDPRITLFIVSGLQDCEGFFFPGDEYTEKQYPGSNQREMLYLAEESLKDPKDFMDHLVAHELQHMIHWNHDQAESFWVEEGLSEYASTLFASLPWTVETFFQLPDGCLIDWLDCKEAENYGRAFLMMDFLITRKGKTQKLKRKLVRQLVNSKASGIKALSEAMQNIEPEFSFVNLFNEFSLTTFFNRQMKQATGLSFSLFVEQGIAKLTDSPRKPAKTFKISAGSVKDKLSFWSSKAYLFNLKPSNKNLSLAFKGQTSKARYGQNKFSIAYVFFDSKHRIAPQIEWLKINGNQAKVSTQLQKGPFDQLLLVVCNSGPVKLHENESGKLPKIAFEFSLVAKDLKLSINEASAIAAGSSELRNSEIFENVSEKIIDFAGNASEQDIQQLIKSMKVNGKKSGTLANQANLLKRIRSIQQFNELHQPR